MCSDRLASVTSIVDRLVVWVGLDGRRLPQLFLDDVPARRFVLDLVVVVTVAVIRKRSCFALSLPIDLHQISG